MDDNEARRTKTARSGGPERSATAESGVKPPKAIEVGDGGAESSPTTKASPSALPDAGVNIVSLWPATMEVRCPSGARYRWNKAGDIRRVASEDVEVVLGHNRSKGRACCGGSAGRTYFALADAEG